MVAATTTSSPSTNRHLHVHFKFTNLLHQWIIIFFASQSFYLSNNTRKRVSLGRKRAVARTTKTLPVAVEAEKEQERKVIFTHPSEPEVSLLEKTLFVLWSIRLVLRQAWSDFLERRWFSGTLVSDAWSHYYVCIRAPSSSFHFHVQKLMLSVHPHVPTRPSYRNSPP